MSLVSNPWVSQVTFKKGQIVLTVRLDGFQHHESVEISGYATQNSGAFAAFYDIQPVKKYPDDNKIMYVKAAPSREFKDGEDVTVVLRAARVWITVLKQQQDGQVPYSLTDRPDLPPADLPSAEDGTIWSGTTAAGYATAGGLFTWTAGETSAGCDSSFQES